MSIKAMKQALEALESWQKTCLDCGRASEELGRATKAITALRQAIAEAEQQEPVGYFSVNDYGNWEQNESNYGTPLYTAPVHASDISQERVDETAKDRHEFVKFRRGDILRCIETEELCTVWATSTSGKTLVTWGGNDFTEYTAEQIGELFWLEPESSDVEIAAEQSDNYASFLAGVRFARVTLFAPPTREWVGLTDEERGMVVNANFGIGVWEMARAIEAKLKEKNI